MHGPFDKPPRGEPNIYQSWNIKLFALPLLLVIALIGYVVSHPKIAREMVEGAQAQFTGTDIGPPSPTLAAQPTNRIHIITAR